MVRLGSDATFSCLVLVEPIAFSSNENEQWEVTTWVCARGAGSRALLF